MCLVCILEKPIPKSQPVLRAKLMNDHGCHPLPPSPSWVLKGNDTWLPSIRYLDKSVYYDHWLWLWPMVSGLVLVPVRQLCPAVERRQQHQHRSGPSTAPLQLQMSGCRAGHSIAEVHKCVLFQNILLLSWCFRISHHVLPVGPPRECLLLLHCVPLHSPLPQPRLHLRHLRLPVIQLHPEGRIQGRRPEPQWLSLLAPLTAKIAHYE